MLPENKERKVNKLDSILDTILPIAELAKRHETILYGPNGDDGFVTEMPIIKLDIKEIKTDLKEIKATFNKAIWSVLVPFVLSVFGFIFLLITHQITLNFIK